MTTAALTWRMPGIAGGRAIFVQDSLGSGRVRLPDTASGKAISSVRSVKAQRICYQGPKAIARSRPRGTDLSVERSELPAAGERAKFFSAQHGVKLEAGTHDENYVEHVLRTIY